MVAYLLAAALASVAQLAPAPQSASGRQSKPLPSACIEGTQDPDWVPVDDHTILVTAGVRHFKVVTDTCPPLHRAFPTITTELLGGSSVCTPEDVRLHVSSGGDVASIYCSIESIKPISETEAKALGRRPY